jgi:hypothetical protein
MKILNTFRRETLQDFIRISATTVSENTTRLLGPPDSPEDQLLSGVLQAVLDVVQDPQHLLSGDGYVHLLAVALQAFKHNPDQLLDLNSVDPLKNVMSQIMLAVVGAATHNLEAKGRNLLLGDTLLEAMDAALATVSKNTQGFRADAEIVSLVLSRLLAAANKDLINELDAENLLQVFPLLLYRAL